MPIGGRRGSVFTFMVVLALTRGFVRCRAWTPLSLGSLRSLTAASRGGSIFSKSTDKDETVRPTTGWNHNQPASWASSSLSGQDKNEPTETTADTDSEPRTGWLHNTAPVKTESSSSSSSSGSVSPAQRRLQQAMKEQVRNHRIVSPPAFHAIGNNHKAAVTEHRISLPLDRSDPKGSQRIDVYFSIVQVVETKDEEWWQSLASLTPQKRAEAYVEHASLKDAIGVMLYLQGGPGFGSPAPVVGLGLSKDSSWAGAALSHYSRIVLMDQRGTGRSTPVTKQSLEKRFPDLFALDGAAAKVTNDERSLEDFAQSHPDESERVQNALEKATDYMSHLRADNIVLDAEEIKDALLIPQEEDEPRPYGAVLGQSFGGFCVMTYLSQVAHPPKVCMLTGGIAPMLTPVYEVYDVLWERVKERSLRYYEMYPGDIAVVKLIVKKLLDDPATLPSGGKLTARRFLQLGLGLGGSPSAFASMHSLLSSAFLQVEDDNELEFTRAFLKRIDSEQSFDDHPIYFLLHESIYADGPQCSPTNWAAHRAYQSRVQTPSDFDYKLTCELDSDARPTLFFGEMVFPWMADGDYAEEGGLGMKSLANSLASKDDWGPLYDAEHMRGVLADGIKCKAAAAVYLEDMYVDFGASMKVAKRGGPLEKCKVLVSNEYQHSGLRDNGANILNKLLGMANGSVRTPS